VQRASGIPHALFGRKIINGSGASRGEGGNLCLDVIASAAKIQSKTPSFRGDAKHRTRNLEIPGLVLRTIPE
jgi:hypothetical protein